ncbi:MAG TPA: hypothetical protein VF041_13150 [Gemmatimonadaceae bacterium]
MTKPVLPALLTLAAVLSACGSDKSTSPTPGCGPAASASVRAGTSAITDQGSLGPMQAITINADGLPNCLTLDADSGTYIVVPQFATGSGARSEVAYDLGVSTPMSADRRGPSFSRTVGLDGVAVPRPLTPQARLDAALREREHALAPLAPEAVARWRASASLRAPVSAATPPLGSTRTFQVLNDLDGGSFSTDTATLRYVGTNIMIYVSQDAPPPPNGFTDTQLSSFGQLFDRDLYQIDVRTFGSPSDIDANGHVIVLLTPKVNALTQASSCQSQGYVSGFFYGVDLTPSQAHSNKGEIFYSLVPDSTGVFSCAHTVSDVEFNTPATFIHEFQHMISWNQHVIVRNGPDEALWLNEGLSHIAEEMGSRYYESRYPAPLGRTNPAQIFPDSAEGFISGDLFNAYAYMLDPSTVSITEFIKSGTVQERGGAWLFLRWLGDQKDSTIYAKLEQTSATGIANVEAQSGEPFPHLFGDFTLALYTDSLATVARSDVPARLRFQSRNLRVLFRALYNATSRRDLVPRPWPLPLDTLNDPGSRSSSMVPGTAQYYVVHLPHPAPAARITFAPSSGGAFPSTLAAQATVFQCPSSAACQ